MYCIKIFRLIVCARFSTSAQITLRFYRRKRQAIQRSLEKPRRFLKPARFDPAVITPNTSRYNPCLFQLLPQKVLLKFLLLQYPLQLVWFYF
jgi:hypothetical protein